MSSVYIQLYFFHFVVNNHYIDSIEYYLLNILHLKIYNLFCTLFPKYVILLLILTESQFILTNIYR